MSGRVWERQDVLSPGSQLGIDYLVEHGSPHPNCTGFLYVVVCEARRLGPLSRIPAVPVSSAMPSYWE